MTTFRDRCRRVCDDHGHLCVGIDPRPGTFPPAYQEADGFPRWCLDLVEATTEVAAAYKPNLAFFLDMGPDGVEALEQVTHAARATGALTILDGKFADVGSTAEAYAAFAADIVGAACVTLNPFLGVEPLRAFQKRGVDAFVLARTTNEGAAEVQAPVLERVLKLFASEGVGFVAPGNDAATLAAVRRAAPGAPLLIPGVGAQGGSAREAANAATGGPFFVNVSRGIAHAEGVFPASAEEAARRFALEMRPTRR